MQKHSTFCLESIKLILHHSGDHIGTSSMSYFENTLNLTLPFSGSGFSVCQSLRHISCILPHSSIPPSLSFKLKLTRKEDVHILRCSHISAYALVYKLVDSWLIVSACILTERSVA